MSGVQDWTLVARAQAGDMDAFAELIRRYQGPVAQFCLRMVGSMQDAEELAQDTFVRVHRHLNCLTPQAKFSTLLFGIARNLALNFLRDSKRRGRDVTDTIEDRLPIRDDVFRPDRQARVNEIESAISRALTLLSDEHREILVLRELNGLDYDAIAEVLAVPKGTVRSRLARAREQLRRQMLGLGGEEL